MAAKIAAILVPLALKAIVDYFRPPAAAGGADTARGALLALPVALLLGYALLRFGSTLFTELRDLLFARVTLQAVAGFVQRTFAHLLALNPRFHVQRNSGMLIRDVERGTAGIAFLLGAALLTLLPTLIGFGGVPIVLRAAGFSVAFTLAIAVTSSSMPSGPR